jgi:small-conductance mechanosensitive channel
MNNFWNWVYLNNTVRDWVIALAIIVGLLLLIRLFRSILLVRIKAWSARTASTIDDFAVRIIERSILPLLYLASVYSGISYLAFAPRVERIIHVAFLVAGTFFVLRLVSAFIHFGLYRLIRNHDNKESREKQLRGILILVNLVVWVIGLVFLLDNLGYDITAVITGLGIGGIAIALASQVILGDLFSYFVIFFDRPFEIGDFITVDDKMGTVEYIGIKTTRVRALSGEQLIFSNTNLTNSRVHNFKRLLTRRIQFSIGVVYETPPDKLRRIPEMVRDIILSHENLKYDRGHFAAFENFSLRFEFVYFVESPDYNLYMDRQQSIYMAIFEAFEKEKIAFAYPTQSLVVSMEQKDGDGVEKDGGRERERATERRFS